MLSIGNVQCKVGAVRQAGDAITELSNILGPLLLFSPLVYSNMKDVRY